MSVSPRFVQISTLTSYPSVLLNRDDSGLAKRIPFGGCTRTRVSSQCRKRHLKTCDDIYGLDKISDELSLSVRSRKLFNLRIASALENEFPKEIVNEVLKAFQSDLYEGKDKSGDGNDGADKKNADPLDRSEVIVLGEPEIRFLTEKAREVCSVSGDVKSAKANSDKFLKKHEKDFLALKCGAGIDAAMFGRFVSGDIEARVSSAVHVAHSFTVHEETFETDYFTAVDDLDPRGAGHINASELTSGLFYNYAVVDVPQLVSNLGEAHPEKWLNKDVDRSVAGKAVEHLIHLFATVTPGAKFGATAPFAYADLVLVEMGERQPRSLANAFSEPVELGQGGLLEKTLGKLKSYLDGMDAMYGLHETRLVACVREAPFSGRIALSGLAESVRKAIESGICG